MQRPCALALACVLLHALSTPRPGECKPYKQRDCLVDCRACAVCAQSPPHSTSCAAQCILCDMCHACLREQVCQWEVRPVPTAPG